MPRPTLPSCLKDIRSFPVLLTKDTEDKIWKQITEVMNEYEKVRASQETQKDRLLQGFQATNPQLAWSEKAWRNLVEPENPREHSFMDLKVRENQRWTWNWQKIQQGTALSNKRWKNAPHDQELCCEAFPEWDTEKEGWSEWRTRLLPLTEADDEEEFGFLEHQNQFAAREAYKQRDSAWIQKHVLINHHQAEVSNRDHSCAQCPEAKEAQEKLEKLEADRLAAETQAKLKILQQEAEIQRIQDEANEAFERKLLEPNPIETEILPEFPCELCNLKFCTRNAQKNHTMSREHKQEERMKREAEQELLRKQREEEKKERESNLEKWFCASCEVQCKSLSHWEQHLAGTRHHNNLHKHEYHCQLCDYKTTFKQVQDRHLESSRHRKKIAEVPV